MRSNLQEQMNLISFKGLSGVKVGDAMHYLPEYHKGYSAIKSLRRFVSALCMERVACNKDNNPNILFLFSNAYAGRKEFEAFFNKVTGLVDKKIVLVPGRNINLKKITHFPLFMHWLKQMKKLRISLKERIYWLSHLAVCVDELFAVKKLLKNNSSIKLLVCLCDTHCQDSIAVQYCNAYGMDTASLQHGDLSAKRNSWAIEGSKSKYYLVYGQYVKDQMKKVNANADKAICVGMPQYINCEFPSCVRTERLGKFGVILSGGWMLECDKTMLMCADVFSRKYDIRYCVKMHPNTKKEDYGTLLHSDRIDACYLTEINILEFGEIVDFAVATNSTVFYEYMLHMIPIFLYEDETIRNVFYEEIQWCRFRNEEELKDLYDMTRENVEKLNIEMRSTRNYLCEMENTAGKYLNFFEKYLS